MHFFMQIVKGLIVPGVIWPSLWVAKNKCTKKKKTVIYVYS